MPTLNPSQEAALEAAAKAKAAQDDANAMDDLMAEVPVIDESAPPLPVPAKNDEPPAPTPPAKKSDEEPPAKNDDVPPVKVDDTTSLDEDKEIADELEENLRDLPPVPKNASPHIKDALAAMKVKMKAQLKRVRDTIKEKEKAELKVKESQEELDKYKDIDPADYKNLREMRRNIAIESDPEFEKKYTIPLKARETEALESLKALKMPDALVNYINEQGGITAFYYSDAPVDTSKVNGGKDDSGKVLSQSEWFKTVVLGHKSIKTSVREDILEAISDARRLAKDRQRAIDTAKKDAPGWEKKRADQMEQQRQDFLTRIEKSVEEATAKLGDLAVELSIPEKADAETKARIEKHNARVKKGTEMFTKFVNDFTPEGRGRLAVAAAQAEVLAEINKELMDSNEAKDKTIKELQDKIENAKRAGQTRRANAAPLPGSTPAAPPSGESDEQAMERLLSETK